MIKLRMKNYSMILTEKQQKYQFYCQVKLINLNILQLQESLPPAQNRIIEQTKFTYSPLGKAFEKQIKMIKEQGEKQIKAIEEHGKQQVK